MGSGRMPRSALDWPGGGRRRRRLAAGRAQPSAQGLGWGRPGRLDTDQLAAALELPEAGLQLGYRLGAGEIRLFAAPAPAFERSFEPAPERHHDGPDRLSA